MPVELTPANPVDLTPANFGLKKSLWRHLLSHRNKTFDSVGRDKFYRENNVPFVTKYSKLHPVQNFSYTFNSWGLRDNVDYDEYYKQPVILCIGDSFTLNVGGPMEHSWPHLLGKMLNLPAVNCGVIRLGPESYHNVAEKLQNYFDVKHLFCMYNLHGDEIVDQMHVNGVETEKKIQVLKSYEWPTGSHVVFDPPWVWSEEQLKIIYSHFPDAHEYLKDISVNVADIPYASFMCLVENDYKDMATSKWPSLENIYQHLTIHNDASTLIGKPDWYWFKKAILPKCKNYFYRSRDYRHLSKLSNQMVADCFYNRAKGLSQSIALG